MCIKVFGNKLFEYIFSEFTPELPEKESSAQILGCSITWILVSQSSNTYDIIVNQMNLKLIRKHALHLILRTQCRLTLETSLKVREHLVVLDLSLALAHYVSDQFQYKFYAAIIPTEKGNLKGCCYVFCFISSCLAIDFSNQPDLYLQV